MSQLSISFLLERVLRLEAYDGRIQNLEDQICTLLEVNQKLLEDFKNLTRKFEELSQVQSKAENKISQELQLERNMYTSTSTIVRDEEEIEVVDILDDTDYFAPDQLAKTKSKFHNSKVETSQEASTSKEVVDQNNQPQNLGKEKSLIISNRGRGSSERIQKSFQIKEKGQPTLNSERLQKRAVNATTGEDSSNKKIKIEPQVQENLLKKYIAVHPGAQPHICLICKGTFTTLANARTHMRIHYLQIGKMINLRLYKCTICKASFSNSGQLKTHLRNHSAKDLYSCSACPKKFYQVGDLHLHIISNHNQNQ